MVAAGMPHEGFTVQVVTTPLRAHQELAIGLVLA